MESLKVSTVKMMQMAKIKTREEESANNLNAQAQDG